MALIFRTSVREREKWLGLNQSTLPSPLVNSFMKMKFYYVIKTCENYARQLRRENKNLKYYKFVVLYIKIPYVLNVLRDMKANRFKIN